MRIGQIYNSAANPEYRIEIKTGSLALGGLHVLPLDEAKRFAAGMLAKIQTFEAESKPESSPEAGDAERLAHIIKANPGAVLRVDNKYWELGRPEPVGFDDWADKRQDAWWEDSELCRSRDFPSLGGESGYGILSVMAGMFGIAMGEY